MKICFNENMLEEHTLNNEMYRNEDFGASLFLVAVFVVEVASMIIVRDVVEYI